MGRITLSSAEILERIGTLPGIDEAVAEILSDKGVPMHDGDVDDTNYDICIKRASFPGVIVIKWRKK